MINTIILELDWAEPIFVDGELKIRNHLTWRNHYEYGAQELLELGVVE